MYLSQVCDGLAPPLRAGLGAAQEQLEESVQHKEEGMSIVCSVIDGGDGNISPQQVSMAAETASKQRS